MFRSLVRGREELHREVTREYFERCANELFTIERFQRLIDTRWIFLFRKK